jgi:hypothetical protein
MIGPVSSVWFLCQAKACTYRIERYVPILRPSFPSQLVSSGLPSEAASLFPPKGYSLFERRPTEPFVQDRAEAIRLYLEEALACPATSQHPDLMSLFGITLV